MRYRGRPPGQTDGGVDVSLSLGIEESSARETDTLIDWAMLLAFTVYQRTKVVLQGFCGRGCWSGDRNIPYGRRKSGWRQASLVDRNATEPALPLRQRQSGTATLSRHDRQLQMGVP